MASIQESNRPAAPSDPVLRRLALVPWVCSVNSTGMAEDVEQIGGRLRSAREAAGLGVDDVAFRTRIPRSVVEALEAEDFSVFISPVYARSFLTQYSDFLNVDAQPWIQALEPGSFMPGGPLQTLLEGPEPQPEPRVSRTEHRGGLLSVLVLLTLTAALVVAAIKGHEFFEIRFGGEGSSPEPVPRVAAPPAMPAKALEPKTRIETEAEELAKPAPRAIIVR